MNKRYLHHLLKRLQRFNYVYLVIALVITGTVFLFSYRHNNVVALQLRDQVLTVDKNNGDIEASLKKLREFTYSHMNANLAGGQGNVYPPIQLKYRYERLVAAQKQATEAVNGQIYTQAQTYCEHLISTGRPIGRVPCIQDYVTSHTPQAAVAIPDALYKFDFVSPVWSPDLAGWTLLASIILAVILVLRLGLEYWLRFSLRE